MSTVQIPSTAAPALDDADPDDLLPPAQPGEIDPSLPVPTASAEPFDPSPETTAALLADLADPALSMRALATLYRTTLDALCAFLARPDIAARVDQVESAYARHARFVAAAHLPAAARYLTRLLDEQVQIVTHAPVRPDNHKALETRRRTLETARRAAALLMRIATFTPGPAKHQRQRHAADEPASPSPSSSSPPPSTPAPSPRLNGSSLIKPPHTNGSAPSTSTAGPPRHARNAKLPHAP